MAQRAAACWSAEQVSRVWRAHGRATLQKRFVGWTSQLVTLDSRVPSPQTPNRQKEWTLSVSFAQEKNLPDAMVTSQRQFRRLEALFTLYSSEPLISGSRGRSPTGEPDLGKAEHGKLVVLLEAFRQGAHGFLAHELE